MLLELKQDIYMDEDLYAPKGMKVIESPYVHEGLKEKNASKGFIPVVIPHAVSLWTGDVQELAVQTHWIKNTDLKEVN